MNSSVGGEKKEEVIKQAQCQKALERKLASKQASLILEEERRASGQGANCGFARVKVLAFPLMSCVNWASPLASRPQQLKEVAWE